MAVLPDNAWGYIGGMVEPDHWASISPSFATCADGNFQSPIRMPWDGTGISMEPFLHKIDFKYKTIPQYNILGNTKFYTALMPTHVPEYEPQYMHVGDHQYELRNITIKTPAEHKFGSVAYDMEMQLHHEDDNGNLASVAILFKAVDDVQGSFYQQFSRGDFWRGATNQAKKGAYLALGEYLPKTENEMHFYAYDGSQTHPPCYEGVQWLIMSKTHQVLKADVEQLLSVYGSNNRPVQQNGDRAIGFF